jgi:hypothetical protein
VICTWPGCTGVHDNNRYAGLCPRSRRKKAIKDQRYQDQGTVRLRRYLGEMHRRRGAQIESLTSMGGNVRGLLTPEQWEARDRSKRDYDARFLNRSKRERPRVPTICTRPVPVAQVLADTANPARTLRVL